MKRIKLSVGDVFRFATSAEKWGYGQILRTDIIQYIVIFEPELQGDVTLSEIVMSQSLFCGWTSDARVYSGDWEIVGNALPRSITFPEYKVEISGEVWVTDVDGEPTRLATQEEAKNLRFKSSHSPIAFEKAFKAHHGDSPWEERFAQLLCHQHRETQTLH